MQKLRSLHLYLGCIFAPMLLFFTVSGIWQTLGLHFSEHSSLALLSSLHTERGLKSQGVSTLSSPLMELFVVAMALAFIVTTILGVVMALKFGKNRRAAIVCLAAGVLAPLACIAITVFQQLSRAR